MASNSPEHKTSSSDRRPPARVRLPLWAMAVAALLLTVGVVWSSVWLFRSVRDMAAATAVVEPEPVLTIEADPDAEGATNNEPADETATATPEPLPTLVADEIKPWSGEERINFLFLGVDRRCEIEGPMHSDSIMLVSVDPLTKSIVILSLPRDLWVDIPSIGLDRINQAFYFGQVYEYPGGGQQLAMETVESVIGLPIDHYITIDFQGFIDAVDLLGGIVVDVPEAIDDTDYPDNCFGYEPFKISAGEQSLDGTAALKYARTRATLGGDIDRAGRQQAVVLAVKEQLTQLNQFPQLLVQAPELWRTFQGNVRTNLAMEDAVQLALLVKDIPPKDIKTAVLDYNYVYTETTPDGRQVLVPRRDQIRALRDELFAIVPVPTPVIENLDELMRRERAKVAVYNGTAVFGLAGRTQEFLEELDVNITEIGNADTATYFTSQIIDYGDNPYTIRFLVEEMGMPPLNFSEGDRDTKPEGDFDLLLIIGSDWAEMLDSLEEGS